MQLASAFHEVRHDPKLGKAIRIYVVAALMAITGASLSNHAQDISYGIARLMLHSSGTQVSAYTEDI